jgi:hypothetical protein
MITCSQLFGFILGVVSSILCLYNPLYTIGLFLVSCSLAFVSSLFIKEDLRRINMHKYEVKLEEEEEEKVSLNLIDPSIENSGKKAIISPYGEGSTREYTLPSVPEYIEE